MSAPGGSGKSQFLANYQASQTPEDDDEDEGDGKLGRSKSQKISMFLTFTEAHRFPDFSMLF